MNNETKNVKREIYYEYLELIELNYKCHLVSVDSDNYNFIIPNSYQIDYSKSSNNYEESGHIYFFNSKHSYSLDYKKKDYDTFIKNIGDSIVKRFKNYKNHEFIEINKNGVDYIYTYYRDYCYKIYSNHKLSINEYYDMYLILFSISKNKISKTIDLLKELYYFNTNYMKDLCNDIDLLTTNLKKYDTEVNIDINSIIIYNDNEYLKYKNTKSKVEDISIKILSDINSDKLEVKQYDKKWYINGSFNFGIFGNFYEGVLFNYDEITTSKELTEEEKKEILDKIINEKQYIVDGYNIKIKEEFYNYLVSYFDRNLTLNLWEEYHIREFINFDIMSNYDKDMNEFSLYKLFMSNLYNNKYLFNEELIINSIKCERIIIKPNTYSIYISALNNLFSSIKIKFNEEFDIINK